MDRYFERLKLWVEEDFSILDESSRVLENNRSARAYRLKSILDAFPISDFPELYPESVQEKVKTFKRIGWI